MATTTSRKPRAIVANPSPKASGKATKSKPERGRDLPEFVLKYAGKPDAINASTFLESLSAVATILHEANRELGTGDPVDVKIKAPKPGSFVVHLIIDPSIADHVASLFKIGGSVIGGLVGALKIWQHLKGKPPKAVKTEGDGTVSIQNESGATIIES